MAKITSHKQGGMRHRTKVHANGKIESIGVSPAFKNFSFHVASGEDDDRRYTVTIPAAEMVELMEYVKRYMTEYPDVL